MNKTGCDNLLILPDTERKTENSTQTICLIYLIYFGKYVIWKQQHITNTLRQGQQKDWECGGILKEKTPVQNI